MTDLKYWANPAYAGYVTISVIEGTPFKLFFPEEK